MNDRPGEATVVHSVCSGALVSSLEPAVALAEHTCDSSTSVRLSKTRPPASARLQWFGMDHKLFSHSRQIPRNNLVVPTQGRVDHILPNFSLIPYHYVPPGTPSCRTVEVNWAMPGSRNMHVRSFSCSAFQSRRCFNPRTSTLLRAMHWGFRHPPEAALAQYYHGKFSGPSPLELRETTTLPGKLDRVRDLFPKLPLQLMLRCRWQKCLGH